MIAKGTFEISFTPQQDEIDVGRMHITKAYLGAMNGAGLGQMLSKRTQVEGSAAYVGVEEFSGALDSKIGKFTLLHKGLMRGDDSSLEIIIVPDSGEGALVGISGKLDITIENGKHYYELDYQL